MSSEFAELLYHDNWMEHEEELRRINKDPKEETKKQIREEVKQDRIRFVTMI